jgi:hypothetical protein
MNWMMLKGTFLAGVGVFAISFSSFAQESFEADSSLTFAQPEIFRTVDSSVLMQQLPVLTLLDGRLPLTTPMGRMGLLAVDLSSQTSLHVANIHRTSVRADIDGKEAGSDVLMMRNIPIYYSGEVGAFYGHASGRFGGDDFGGYVFGTVGTDKFQVSGGASYEEFSGHIPRWRP